MPTATLDERVTVLEIRVDELSARYDEAVRFAADARDAHRHNTTLLNAVRVTQAEHSKTLAEHSRRLAEHDRRFDAIDATLAEHTTTLNEHTRTLNEHTRTLNEHTTILGKLMVGMHSIQLSLKHLIDREGNGSHEDSAN